MNSTPVNPTALGCKWWLTACPVVPGKPRDVGSSCLILKLLRMSSSVRRP
jgi:hypothetical protein